MKICLAQLNYLIGDFEGNRTKIKNAIERAKSDGATLIVFSELAVCGYPPEDFLDYEWFVDACMDSVHDIAAACQGITCVVGSVDRNSGMGRSLHNAAFVLRDGAIVSVHHKSLLPTYDVFHEARYFEPSGTLHLDHIQGVKTGVLICEDLWDHHNDFSYARVPLEELKAMELALLINPAASPFQWGKEVKRREVLQDNARRFQLPVVYVNQVGAHADLIFDGNSMVVDAEGKVILELPRFEEHLAYVELAEDGLHPEGESPAGAAEPMELLHDAIVFGIREYCAKNGFRKVVLGASGGIDSAVVQALACRALGPSNVQALLMPSPYSSEGSVLDAQRLSENLGNPYLVLPINQVFESTVQSMQPAFGALPQDVTEENIQARIRGQFLMAFSNKHAHLLLNTSNKSEMAVGYSTLYGDLCGGLSPIGDVYKTRVYALANYINRQGEVIPEAILVKEPSAELRPNQKDQDSLPPYEVLDALLFQYIEARKGMLQLVQAGFDAALVQRVVQLVHRNEYKRYQAPPILRVSSKAFGSGRRMPLVAKHG
jgi:NAD+ synthase (glutamine-hydrolysing)